MTAGLRLAPKWHLYAEEDALARQVLEEFYENLQSVGVSAMTGEGMPAFFDKVTALAALCGSCTVYLAWWGT